MYLKVPSKTKVKNSPIEEFFTLVFEGIVKKFL